MACSGALLRLFIPVIARRHFLFCGYVCRQYIMIQWLVQYFDLQV